MSRRPIELVVTDVDGTLVRTDKSLSDSTKRAALRLTDAGIQLALVSGRAPSGLLWLADELRLATPVIGHNGGLILSVPDGLPLLERVLDREVAEQCVEALAEFGITYWIYTREAWHLEDPNGPHVDEERETIRAEPVVGGIHEALGRALKIVAVCDQEALLRRAGEELGDRLGDRARALLSQEYYLDVTHPEADKGIALAWIADHLDVPLDRVATIGDMPNDVPMFKRAAYSIAMGGAPGEVSEAADAQVGSNDGEGFAEAIDLLLFPSAE